MRTRILLSVLMLNLIGFGAVQASGNFQEEAAVENAEVREAVAGDDNDNCGDDIQDQSVARVGTEDQIFDQIDINYYGNCHKEIRCTVSPDGYKRCRYVLACY